MQVKTFHQKFQMTFEVNIEGILGQCMSAIMSLAVTDMATEAHGTLRLGHLINLIGKMMSKIALP